VGSELHARVRTSAAKITTTSNQTHLEVVRHVLGPTGTAGGLGYDFRMKSGQDDVLLVYMHVRVERGVNRTCSTGAVMEQQS